MTSNCENHEISLSALLDDELSFPERLTALDHLVECEGCRDFYRRSRSLGRALAPSRSAEPDTRDSDLDAVWDRIVADHARRHGGARRVLQWAPRLAAVLLLGFGLWWLQASWRGTPPGPGDSRRADTLATTDTDLRSEDRYIEVDLEGQAGQMTDERFVQLTTEVLQADHRYHLKMLEVMSMVADTWSGSEGSGERAVSRSEETFEGVSLGESTADETLRFDAGSLL